jgi:hypothetical protein
MRILRHSKITVTMEIYTEATDEDTREALRKLGTWLGGHPTATPEGVNDGRPVSRTHRMTGPPCSCSTSPDEGFWTMSSQATEEFWNVDLPGRPRP